MGAKGKRGPIKAVFCYRIWNTICTPNIEFKAIPLETQPKFIKTQNMGRQSYLGAIGKRGSI